MSKVERSHIPAGTPVLIAGYAELPYNEYGFRHTIKVAYSGRLLEECRPGSSVMLASGQFAGSIPAKSVIRHRPYDCGRSAHLVETDRLLDGAKHFLVFEDREGLVDESAAGPQSWPKPMVLAQRVAAAASDRMYEHIDLSLRAGAMI